MDERQERDSRAFEGLTATMTPEQEVATRHLLTDRLRLSVAEADSLIATVHRRQDLSLIVLLASETR